MESVTERRSTRRRLQVAFRTHGCRCRVIFCALSIRIEIASMLLASASRKRCFDWRIAPVSFRGCQRSATNPLPRKRETYSERVCETRVRSVLAPAARAAAGDGGGPKRRAKGGKGRENGRRAFFFPPVSESGGFRLGLGGRASCPTSAASHDAPGRRADSADAERRAGAALPP